MTAGLGNSFGAIFADMRYAIRNLAKTPTVTAAILMATALGIGVNTGIFSLLNAVAFRPLPVKDAGRVVSIYQTFQHDKSAHEQPRYVDGTPSLFSWPEYQEYRDHNEVLSGLAAYAPFEATLDTATAARKVQGELVSCNYFAVLGKTPVLGRDFSREDCQSRGTSPYIILSQAFWQSRFGRNSNVLGSSIIVNRHPFTVIGIAPESFAGTSMAAVDFWAPSAMQQELRPRGTVPYLDNANLSWLYVLGRWKTGVSMEQVRANLAVIAKRIDQGYPGRETRLDIAVASLFSEPEDRGSALSAGAVVMIAVGLVLLIACANVANLLLARASGRQREIAVRLSMGATRSRLVQQLLTESLLLAVAGGVLGALLSFWSLGVFYRWTLTNLPGDAQRLAVNLSPDARVFGFALILSLATGIVFGLLPALQATRLDLNSVLKQESRSASRQSRGWLRSMLLATQVAVCLVLLVAAGLILRALAVAQIRDPGFNTRDVVAASLELEQAGYNEERAARFYRLLTDRLREQPGVKATALATVLPLSGGRMGDGGVVDGHEFQLTFNTVSPEYFDVLNIPIVRGRGFLKSENTGREPVAIVSESTARRFWPGADPIGKQIRMGEPKVAHEVVGVAKDVYATELSKIDSIFVYVPAKLASLGLHVLARGPDAAALTRQMREIAAGIDRNVFVETIELQENVRRWQSPMRILVALSSVLGMLALLLAATGIFGVVNYTVSQRTHEIGTRMALGADASGILRMMIAQSLRPVFIGAALGLAVAAAVSRILNSVLFGVSPLDPAAFLGMLLLLIVVASAASFLPAQRAARTDPAAALRHE